MLFSGEPAKNAKGRDLFSQGVQEAAWLPEASHLHTWGGSWEGLAGTKGVGITSFNLPQCPR